MSKKTDIDLEFKLLIEKHPELEEDILECESGVFESLDWESPAADIVKKMIKKNYNVDNNMRAYLKV